jgi:hypothetical protein
MNSSLRSEQKVEKLLQYCLFINLDERPDRRNYVINELSKIGCNNPERVPAVKMEHGAVGCSFSHIKCLELAKERNYPYVFICEDDITFLNPTLLVENIGKYSKSFLMDYFNVLIIGGNNCPPYSNITKFCIKVLNCQSTLGYIVKQKYYNTLIANMKEGLHFLLKNPLNKREFAVDMYWKQLQKKDNWHMIIPATVTQLPGYSDVEKQNVNYNHLMLDIEKKELLKYHGVTFTPSQVDLSGFSFLENEPVPTDEINNLPSSQATEKQINFSTLRFEKLIFDSGDASVKNVNISNESIQQEEHKKKFSIVLMTIHLIPLFYNIKTYFDFILTDSELDI